MDLSKWMGKPSCLATEQASDVEEDKYLPGHFTVGRILQRTRRRGEDIYKIQLRSGEHDQVSISCPTPAWSISTHSPHVSANQEA